MKSPQTPFLTTRLAKGLRNPKMVGLKLLHLHLRLVVATCLHLRAGSTAFLGSIETQHRGPSVRCGKPVRSFCLAGESFWVMRVRCQTLQRCRPLV
jgi:hypothetical protein